MNLTIRQTVRVLAALVAALGMWAAGNALLASQPAIAAGAVIATVAALAVWRRTRSPAS